jgi:hypothetical protein
MDLLLDFVRRAQFATPKKFMKMIVKEVFNQEHLIENLLKTLNAEDKFKGRPFSLILLQTVAKYSPSTL